MQHPIQTIFQRPLFGNQETVSFCQMVFPQIVSKIQQCEDDTQALGLLRKLVSEVVRHGFPDDVRNKYVLGLMRIEEYFYRVKRLESPEEEAGS